MSHRSGWRRGGDHMRTRIVATVWAAVVAAGVAPAAAGTANRPGAGAHDGTAHVTGSPGKGGLVEAGAASRSVLPLVDGSLRYTDAGFPSADDAIDPGVLVPEWDDGRIAVGNGESEAHWVHDDLRVRALAVRQPSEMDITVLLAADLYMIFRTDVNHDWYEHMTDQAADAVVDAVDELRPARLRVGAGEHWFGMDDGTDPQVIDPRMDVLQAVATNGRVIGTVVQWNNHPETTLNWSPPADLSADCAVLGWTGEACTAEGRYFTADYPGVVSEFVSRSVGGETLYFVGALGEIVGPGGASVWEVDAAHPLGDHFHPPAGAGVPGGDAFTYTDDNFRRAVVIGEQAARAALDIIEGGEWIGRPTISYRSQTFYSRLSNLGFRVLLVVDPATGYTQLGHIPPTAYTCPATGPKTDATCTDVGTATEEDPIAGTIRSGDHLESEVGYLRIGTVGMMFLPGEVAGEIVAGLPAEFRTDPGRWYDEPAGLHAFGDDFTTPGYVLNRMHDRYEFTIGLGNDELGYIFPISNWRVACVADQFAGEGTCQALHDAGVIEHPDAVAGTTCKAITEDPARLEGYPPDAALAVSASCRYGQALGEAQGHYEETNSAGWDLAADMLAAVAALTSDDDPEQVNPEFPGYWLDFPPPAG